ncbi:hypothetical protein [Fontibacillus sp. BL9]|uniref:hypothetical protein n=1 Tax=Fontibacillus sp. BL9 TaxID=3389971 RepID=UPI0039787D01
MKVIKKLASALLIILAFIYLIIFIIGIFTPMTENVGLAGILAVVFAIAAMLINRKPTYKAERVKLSEELKGLGVIVSSPLHHIQGLPLAEKTQCNVHVTPHLLIIEGGGTTFELKMNQIRAAEVKTDVEIANSVHSSAAKGIAGGLLFGPVGAMVGARATNKKQTTFTYYLIINFENSQGETAALLFDGGNMPLKAQRISNKLYPFLKQNPKVTVQL